ncbi:hypothetical protein FA13DRAFT_1711110 [Coprinellus micaceus]|uniref:Uncharacterized protein n=1 Tax=Coprinellus micaceus TaxID=71717 RepID=A0A4Y7T7E0_COPMI|nr:hypothetical protein FA13DRAFT_1711110 [Coprinellus micaceus]
MVKPPKKEKATLSIQMGTHGGAAGSRQDESITRPISWVDPEKEASHSGTESVRVMEVGVHQRGSVKSLFHVSKLVEGYFHFSSEKQSSTSVAKNVSDAVKETPTPTDGFEVEVAPPILRILKKSQGRALGIFTDSTTTLASSSYLTPYAALLSYNAATALSPRAMAHMHTCTGYRAPTDALLTVSPSLSLTPASSNANRSTPGRKGQEMHFSSSLPPSTLHHSQTKMEHCPRLPSWSTITNYSLFHPLAQCLKSILDGSHCAPPARVPMDTFGLGSSIDTPTPSASQPTLHGGNRHRSASGQTKIESVADIRVNEASGEHIKSFLIQESGGVPDGHPPALSWVVQSPEVSQGMNEKKVAFVVEVSEPAPTSFEH